MKTVKSAVLISVFATLGFLSGCGPAELETGAPGAQPASVESASQPLCEMSFCNSDADCSPCPGYSVSCNGFVCAFTSTGGGGGGGGYCDGAFCNTDSDCTSVCHNTSTAWCNNGICAP